MVDLVKRVALPLSEVACRAADEIERRGLHKGGYAESDDPSDWDDCSLCALGALRIAAEASPFLVEYVGAVLDVARRIEYVVKGPVARWNDDPATTADDVVRVLRAVGARARGGGAVNGQVVRLRAARSQAALRVQLAAQDRHRRLEAERVHRLESEFRRGGRKDDQQADHPAAAELLLRQMRASAVDCCDAGRTAFPGVCPWHGQEEQR